jgi:restriction system protein
MPWNEEPIELTPEQFEREVRKILQKSNANLKAFEVNHREKIPGAEGIYEIDVTARFEALGAEYLTLIECKHQKNPIKREVVQILHDKIRTTGAHKGMIFATTTFQRGAIEYASAHGIALVRMVEGKTSYETKAFGIAAEPPPWANIPPYVGYFYSLTDEGDKRYTLVSVKYSDALNEFLGF